MPVPSATDFDRLQRLVAIADPQQRSTRPVEEVFTGREIATIPVGTAADVTAVVDIGRKAQVAWAERPVKERARIIERFRDLVVARREFLMDVAQAETGKARSAAQEEIARHPAQRPLLRAHRAEAARVAAGRRACCRV